MYTYPKHLIVVLTWQLFQTTLQVEFQKIYVLVLLLLFLSGAQYGWLKKDLLNIDRSVTPWLVAAWHPPWYNSYSSHYQEFECMRQEMEALLYQYGVDIVLSGHVS